MPTEHSNHGRQATNQALDPHRSEAFSVKGFEETSHTDSQSDGLNQLGLDNWADVLLSRKILP